MKTLRYIRMPRYFPLFGFAILVFGIAVLVGANVAAQNAAMSHHDHVMGSMYRELPAPPLMQGIGNANMKITTSSDAAQAYFNQGLRLLHDFWDFEAYRAFKEAARLDPSAAMAYWGEFEALKMRGPVMDDGRAALEKAKSLADKVSKWKPSWTSIPTTWMPRLYWLSA
jgi:hypothetical protein